MTIVESIKEVLKLEDNEKLGMTSAEIYHSIISRNLYQFGAKNPLSVVDSQLRKHCCDMDFQSASVKKYFTITKTEGRQHYYTLIPIDPSSTDTQEIIEIEKFGISPEEKMLEAFKEHCKQIKIQLLEMILLNDSAFFEKMVVELLMKMGYGYDENSGIVTGKSHDGGIDGIIKEDKLGLDSIYIQAKRYKTDNTVKSPEIQQFIGAMGKVNKGVFITTFSFTSGAIKNAESAYKNIRLIDGTALADLMALSKVS